MKSTCIFSILMLVIIASANSVEAQSLYFYGTERVTGDIYRIKSSNGDVLKLATLSSLTLSPSLSPAILPLANDSPNGNALDAATNRFYFATFKDPGSQVYNPDVKKSELYFVDLDDSPIANVYYAGQLLGHASDAAFYNGYYYYIKHGTNELNYVTFKSDGTIQSEDLLLEIRLNNFLYGGTFEPRLAFGDIEFQTSSRLYITGRNTNNIGQTGYDPTIPSTYYFGGYCDLNGANPGLVTELGVQTIHWGGGLAFNNSGKLYTNEASTGAFYEIKLNNGQRITSFTTTPVLHLTDLASPR